MTNRHRMSTFILTLGLIIPPVASAHKGHDHTVMGTVSVIHENHLEVKDKEGKTVTVTLNDKTKILTGTIKAAKADIREGDRIVVTYQSQEKDKINLATTIKLAAKRPTQTK